MSADWQVGDLAVCVNTDIVRAASGMLNAGKHLALGAVYRVTGVSAPHSPDTPGPILTLEGVKPVAGAWRFRKIRPDEPTQCEPEFQTLLRRSKRRVSA